MSPVVDLLLVLVLSLNFLMLGTGRLRVLIQAAAAQGVALGFLLAAAHATASWRGYALAGAAIALKGLIIPTMLTRAVDNLAIRREVEPFISFVSSLVLVGLGTGLAVVFGQSLPLLEEHATSLLVPASLSTVLSGFLILTTRKKAITQVVGYLTLENGVFLFGLVLVEAMPMMVEIGVLLDLVVGIFVMGILIDKIHAEFSSIDTDQLTALKD